MVSAISDARTDDLKLPSITFITKKGKAPYLISAEAQIIPSLEETVNEIRALIDSAFVGMRSGHYCWEAKEDKPTYLIEVYKTSDGYLERSKGQVVSEEVRKLIGKIIGLNGNLTIIKLKKIENNRLIINNNYYMGLLLQNRKNGRWLVYYNSEKMKEVKKTSRNIEEALEIACVYNHEVRILPMSLKDKLKPYLEIKVQDIDPIPYTESTRTKKLRRLRETFTQTFTRAMKNMQEKQAEGLLLHEKVGTWLVRKNLASQIVITSKVSHLTDSQSIFTHRPFSEFSSVDEFYKSCNPKLRFVASESPATSPFLRSTGSSPYLTSVGSSPFLTSVGSSPFLRSISPFIMTDDISPYFRSRTPSIGSPFIDPPSHRSRASSIDSPRVGPSFLSYYTEAS